MYIYELEYPCPFVQVPHMLCSMCIREQASGSRTRMVRLSWQALAFLIAAAALVYGTRVLYQTTSIPEEPYREKKKRK